MQRTVRADAVVGLWPEADILREPLRVRKRSVSRRPNVRWSLMTVERTRSRYPANVARDGVDDARSRHRSAIG